MSMKTCQHVIDVIIAYIVKMRKLRDLPEHVPPQNPTKSLKTRKTTTPSGRSWPPRAPTLVGSEGGCGDQLSEEGWHHGASKKLPLYDSKRRERFVYCTKMVLTMVDHRNGWNLNDNEN